MGLGLIEHARTMVAAGTPAALRSWGDQLATAAEALGYHPLASKFTSLDEGLARMAGIDEATVRTSGWEHRLAFTYQDDGQCVQRALLGALSLGERVTGSITGALRSVGAEDARAAAVIVAYPRGGFGDTNAVLHAATLAKAADGRALVIDHLLADSADGVMDVADWMERAGVGAHEVRVLAASYTPPLTPKPMSGGVPISARPVLVDGWRELADQAATMIEETAAGRVNGARGNGNAGTAYVAPAYAPRR
jgi:hypothetical protein